MLVKRDGEVLVTRDREIYVTGDMEALARWGSACCKR